MKKNIVYVIGSILVVVVIGVVVYFKQPNKNNEAVVGDDLLTLKVLDARLPLAQVEILKKQFEAAVVAVQTNPDSYNDWITIGIIKKQVNDYDGARVVWEKAVVLRPAGSLPLYNLANLYADFLNNPQKAEEYYLAALRNSPDLTQGYTNLADLYKNKLNQPEKVEPLILDGLSKTNNDPNFYAYLGGFYKETKNYAKAMEYFEKLLKVNPDDATIKAELVNLRAKLR